MTRPVELAVEFLSVGPDPWGGTRAGVDFNIPLEGDRFVIGDRVTINLQVEAVLQKESAPVGA